MKNKDKAKISWYKKIRKTHRGITDATLLERWKNHKAQEEEAKKPKEVKVEEVKEVIPDPIVVGGAALANTLAPNKEDIKAEAIAESKMSDEELKEKFEVEIDKADVALDKVLDSVPPVV